jgi:hypothetical protein
MVNGRGRGAGGFSFAEYVFLLAAVSAIFIGMNTYVKRGAQAKIKGLTDHFIGAEQASDYSTSDVTSETRTEESTTANQRLLKGGGIQVAMLDRRYIESNSTALDTDPTFIPSSSAAFVTKDRSEITIPEYGNNTTSTEELMKDDWSDKSELQGLENKYDTLIREASDLMDAANSTASRGRDLIRQANNIDCNDDDDCEDAQDDIRASGNTLLTNSTALLSQAEEKLAAAQELESEIDTVRARLNVTASNTSSGEEEELVSRIEDAQEWRRLLVNGTDILGD